MTISNLDPKVVYVGDGVTKTFAVPFEFFDGTDILVRLYQDYINDSDTFSTLRYGIDYTVTGGSGSTGSMTTVATYTSANMLEVVSNVPYGQDTAYQPHTPFQADAHERALDRLAVQIKQVASFAGAFAGAPSSDVTSVFGRSGDIVAEVGDYSNFYALHVHVHSWSEITSKPSVFPPDYHTHPWADITGKPSTFTPSAHTHSWGEITSKPGTFTPSPHTHLEADITDLDKYTKAETDALFSTVTRPKLDELTDVTAPLPVSGDVLTWDSTLQAWKNAQPTGGGTGGAVDSVFGRSGAVVAQTGDYSWAQIASKPTTFAPSAHTHPISDVTNLQTTLDGKSDDGHTHTYDSITSKPTEFPPEAHSHPISDVQNLQTTLDGKSNTGHTHAIADVTGLQVALNGKQTIGVYAGVTSIDVDTALSANWVGKMIVGGTKTTAIVISIPANNDTDFPVGTRIDFFVNNSGGMTFTIDGDGVTQNLRSPDNKRNVTIYGAASLMKLSPGFWGLTGTLS